MAIPIWSRFTSGSVASAALARTKNGVLHIVFRDGTQVKHTTVDAAGKPAGASTVVAAAAETPGPWLIAAPDGTLLTAVFTSGGSLHTAASKDAGATWNASAPLATTVAAAVVGGKDGKPLLLLAGSGRIQLQEPPAAAETVYESASCCGDGQRAALALDAESAEAWAAWPEKSAQLGGVMAKAVKPSTGKALPAPGARFDASSPLSLSARLGAPGVYLAYATAGNRQASQIKLWNVRGGEALTIARAPARRQPRLPGSSAGRPLLGDVAKPGRRRGGISPCEATSRSYASAAPTRWLACPAAAHDHTVGWQRRRRPAGRAGERIPRADLSESGNRGRFRGNPGFRSRRTGERRICRGGGQGARDRRKRLGRLPNASRSSVAGEGVLARLRTFQCDGCWARQVNPEPV